MHTQGDNLPHQDSKAPHVRFGGEERVDQRLGRHPPYRQRVPAMSRLDHLSIPVRESGHAEVGDLAQLVMVHEHVPRGEIAVDDLQNRIKTRRLDQHSSLSSTSASDRRWMFCYATIQPYRITRTVSS